jgi:leucyl/phenylalanyl-tRNA--protein transferase
MPVFALDQEIIFPHPLLSEPEGLLAIGGDLSVQRLLLAYRWGIFPWYHDDQPILWWWPSPRLVLRPSEVHISHSMKNVLKRHQFHITVNANFPEVMIHCGRVDRKGQAGTWITQDIIDAYVMLHQLGFAHSIEVYEDDALIGGLYGIALGKLFFGESMFAEKPNASKIAFIYLARHLEKCGMERIDCQQDTSHLRSLGATLISGDEFLQILRNNQIFMLENRIEKSLFQKA